MVTNHLLSTSLQTKKTKTMSLQFFNSMGIGEQSQKQTMQFSAIENLYTKPIDLSQFDKKSWITDEKDLWYIVEKIFATKHYPILSRKQIASLRKADHIEVQAGNITEWKQKLSPHPWNKKN